MRFPRFRLTIRRMMILVAIVGVAIFSVELASRRRAYLLTATDHRRLANNFRLSVDLMYEDRRDSEMKWIVEMKSKVLAMAQWHEAMIVKYERAARYPWLPVEPDPPMPK